MIKFLILYFHITYGVENCIEAVIARHGQGNVHAVSTDRADIRCSGIVYIGIARIWCKRDSVGGYETICRQRSELQRIIIVYRAYNRNLQTGRTLRQSEDKLSRMRLEIHRIGVHNASPRHRPEPDLLQRRANRNSTIDTLAIIVIFESLISHLVIREL